MDVQLEMIIGLLFVAATYRFEGLTFIPYDLNDAGCIVGATRSHGLSGEIDSPMLLSNGKLIWLGEFPGGGIAKTINRFGDVLIFSEHSPRLQNQKPLARRAGHSGCYFWSKGKSTFVGNFDQVGRLTGDDQFIGCVESRETRIKILNGTVSRLPVPIIAPKTSVGNFTSQMLTFDMNDAGTMVGTTDFGTSWSHAYKMDRQGHVTDLHPIVDMHTGWSAQFINSRGHILGYHSYDSSVGGGALFLWKDGNCTDGASEFPGGLPFRANSFNDQDQCVGTRLLNQNGSTHHRLANEERVPPYPAYATNHAVIFFDGKTLDLNELSDAPKDCVLESATKINNNGWIVGTCVQNRKRFGFLLRPRA